MKIKIFIMGIVILITLGIFLSSIGSNNNLTNDLSSNPNTLTMMLETDVDSNEYTVATSNEWPQEGYVFNQDLSYCEQGSTLLWNEESKSISLKTSITDKCFVYFDKEPEIIYLADYIKNVVYTGVDGENDLYYHDGIGSYTNASEEAGDNSYRYSGANPNNYVCFASDETTCPEDNLYRIIGVFGDQVKLIKNTVWSSYTWDADIIDFTTIYNVSNKNKKYDIVALNGILAAPEIGGSNIWQEADLYYYINHTFLETFSEKWLNLIDNYVWQIGGLPLTNGAESSVKTVYEYEIGSSSIDSTVTAQVGLMYISDYMYAANPSYWLYIGTNYQETIAYNWLFLTNLVYQEWSITKQNAGNFGTEVFVITSDGNIGDSWPRNPSIGSNRPTFYLKSNVTLTAGTGTIDNPYRVDY